MFFWQRLREDERFFFFIRLYDFISNFMLPVPVKTVKTVKTMKTVKTDKTMKTMTMNSDGSPDRK